MTLLPYYHQSIEEVINTGNNDDVQRKYRLSQDNNYNGHSDNEPFLL